MKLLKLAVAVLLFAMSTSARDSSNLPDKPQPRTANKEFWIETGALATAWTMDTISTEELFDRHPEFHEIGPLFTGSRSVPKIMGSWGAIDIAAVIVSYEWKRRVHNRYLHPLWRVPLLYRAEGHFDAAIHNMSK